MNFCRHIKLMAAYNVWMNTKVYEVAAKLTPAALGRDRQAFFKSIQGTLNHIAVADTMWLKRFALHSAGSAVFDPIRQIAMPTTLDQVLFTDFGALSEYRKLLDATITAWVELLTENDFEQLFDYTTTKGVATRKRLSGVVLHFFNHQTHHRGQVTTQLSQAGCDVGGTDLLVLIPNEIQI